jgi:hypothetical protein
MMNPDELIGFELIEAPGNIFPEDAFEGGSFFSKPIYNSGEFYFKDGKAKKIIVDGNRVKAILREVFKDGPRQIELAVSTTVDMLLNFKRVVINRRTMEVFLTNNFSNMVKDVFGF